MRLVRSSLLACVAVFATVAASQASTLGLDVTSDTQIFAPGVYTNIGWQFTVNAPIAIDGLGLFDEGALGLAERHQVGLWDSGGTLLASTLVSNSSPVVASVSGAGDWRFEDIAPVILMPGTYITGAFFSSSADSVIASATVTTIPELSFLHSRASSEAAFDMPGAYGLVEPGVFAANVRVADIPVPEPSSMLLLTCGLASAYLTRRREKRTR